MDWVVDIANEANPPLVNSMSWGTIEQVSKCRVGWCLVRNAALAFDRLTSQEQAQSDLDTFNTEAMKCGAIGVTIVVSSGDNGVINFGCPCNTAAATSPDNCACNAPSGSAYSLWAGTNTWTGNGYFPSWPATSPVKLMSVLIYDIH